MHLSRLVAATALVSGLCRADLRTLATLDGVSGYEGPVLEYVRRAVGGRQEVDNTGSLTATFGSGKPHTLLIAGIDEPGYVISAITEEGYLRVHRVATKAPHYNFEDFFLGQPVRVTTADGKRINAVMAALSVHLQSERASTPRVDHPEQLYVDMGARSAREVREAGVEVLDPISLEKSFTRLDESLRISAPWISSRAGASILIELAKRMANQAPTGTVTLAFVSQQYAGHRGLARIAERVDADRVVWIKAGGGSKPAVAAASDDKPEMANTLLKHASRAKLDLDRETAERLSLPSFAKEEIWKHPERVASLTVGVENAGTPVEVISLPVLGRLQEVLSEFVGAKEGRGSGGGAGGGVTHRPPLEVLVETYGVSGREERVREKISSLLPEWARKASRVDKMGNLIVALAEKPERMFLAHMDELGFEITEIQADGKLWAETRGGGTPEFVEWHAALVHTEKESLPAIILGGGGGLRHRVQVDFGAMSAEDARARGVKVGDTVTIRKQYRPLLGRRVNARSLDDRAGCAVLIDALRSLKPEQIRRPTWLVFTVQEEVGLKGAEFLAESVRPKEVYPIDTFVSSDSPLENPRLADARLGDGFTIRAIDSSGIAPREAVQRVAALARKHNIPVQRGVTSGANDGSKFVTGGAINIPLGWPLRYSHSPAEAADLGDIEALRRIVAALLVE